METYIIYFNVTGSGMRDFDFDNPDFGEKAAQKALEAVGGKFLHAWATLGRHDLIAVVEVPNATAVRAFVACLPPTMKTETARAFPGQIAASDFLDNVKKILKAAG